MRYTIAYCRSAQVHYALQYKECANYAGCPHVILVGRHWQDSIDPMSLSRVHLILVEDDDVDAEFVQRVLHQGGIGAPVTLFRDGLEAVQALDGPQREWLKTRPLLILLDLNMPRLNGFEFLDILRGSPEWKSAIVFILTQSTRNEDIEAAYDRQVAGYLLKSNLGKDYSLLPHLLLTYCRLVALQPGNH